MDNVESRINVSQLQPSQMSGLAMLLNSLMRGAAAEAGVPPVPAASYAQVGAPYIYPPPQTQTQQQHSQRRARMELYLVNLNGHPVDVLRSILVPLVDIPLNVENRHSH